MKSMSATFPERAPVCALSRSRIGQDGFALVSAIFLLVVLALLGAGMLVMSTVQHTTSAQDVLGSRAYQAARTGIEWNVYQIMQPENTNPAATPFTTQYNCQASPYVFSQANGTALGGTLADFTVTVTCVRQIFNEGGNRISTYQLTSTATYGTSGSVNYAERSISATVSTCRKTDDGENC